MGKLLEIKEMNLEPIIIKSMDKEEGYTWSFNFAQNISNEYKKFLFLCLKYPNQAIVPSSLVDDFWHLHILDTYKYQKDCEKYLGFFLHHFPYFGMRGEEDEKNLYTAWSETLKLYRGLYGDEDRSIWIKSKRCPNCGRRTNNMASEKRPAFKDYNFTLN